MTRDIKLLLRVRTAARCYWWIQTLLLPGGNKGLPCDSTLFPFILAQYSSPETFSRTVSVPQTFAGPLEQ